MKHTVKHMLTVCLSVLLVLTMVLSLPLNVLAAASTPAPATAGVKDVDGDGVITYVSFGDSVTNGYGMDGYRYADGTNVLGYKREVATAYPAMTAKYLESKGFKVKLEQLAVSGYRMDELHWLLDMENFQGDQYHNARFADWNKGVVEDLLSTSTGEDGKAFREMCKTLGYTTDADILANASKIISAEYVNAVKNADLITIDLGTNNFGTFLTSTIQYVLGLSSTEIKVDFTQYMDVKSAESLDAIISQMVTQMVGTDAAAHKLGVTLARCLMYGYLGYVNHYDAAIERIYELNPEVQVVVLDIYSMLSGVDLTGGALGDKIDLDEMYNLFIDLASNYAREQSPWASKVTHASLDNAPELFVDYFKAYQYPNTLNTTAQRLMDEFIMEAMGTDPDDPSARAAFEKNILAPLKTLDDYVTNLKANIEELAFKPVSEGVAGASAKVDEAIEGADKSDIVVDIIADVVEENKGQFKGSSSSNLVKAIAIKKIKEELDDNEDMMTQIGIAPTGDNKDELADALYEVACIYYDEGGLEANTEPHARKLANIEIMRYVLVKTQGMGGAEAQTTAELAYELYTIHEKNGEKAAVIAAIKTKPEYAGEGVAEGMYNMYVGKPTETDMVKVLGTQGIPENVAKAMHACYTQKLDGQYNNANVKTVMLFAMVSMMEMKQADAETAYAQYVQYKSVAVTLSKIANCKTIYFDALLAEAGKGIDLDAVAEKFMNGTLVLDEPGKDASEAQWNAYKTDSALAVLYFRFMTQDGVFTHPNEVGQQKMTSAVTAAVEKLNIPEGDSEIELNKDSKVLILGDFIAAEENGYVAKIIQNAVSVGYKTTNLSNDAYRINEVRALLDSAYAGDAYTAKVLGNDKNTLSKQYTDAVKESNVVLVHLGAMNMGFIAEQMKQYVSTEGTTYAMNFASIGGMAQHKLGERVDSILTNFQKNLSADSKAAGVLLAFESFNYGYATFTDCLDNTVETIQKLNPNADIILVGQYDLLDGAYFDAEGIYLEMGEFIGRGVSLMNGYMKNYADMTDNVTYIDITGTETQLDTLSGGVNMGTAEGFEKAFANALPTDKGNQHIATRLACALGGHPKAVNLTWHWSKDYGTATASYECGVCGSDVKLNGAITKVEEKFCDKEGTVTYTATVMIDGKAYTDVAKAGLPVTGHTYGEPTWSWNADHSKATAKFICTVCKHEEEKNAAVSAQTVPASCDTAGKHTFTATVKLDGKDYTNTKEVSIPAAGHKYGEPVWTWSEDYSTAKAVLTCAVCKHEASAEGKTTAEASTEANCYVDGYVKHVAKVTVDGKEYAGRTQQTLPAGHKYVDGICSVCKQDINDYSVYRIYGDNRYQTSIGVAEALKAELGVDKFDNIIIASGNSFADALAGSYLAAVKNAPILITNEHNQEVVQMYAFKNLKQGGTLYILGGESAVQPSFDKGLTSFLNVKRLAGENRYETNLAILKEAGVAPGSEILVCTGKKFADSLSASAVGKPILLVRDELFESQTAYLKTLGTDNKFVIIGGDSAVSADMAESLKAYGTTDRIGGANRYDTSVLVAERYFEKPESAVVAYGRKFPDGLCGGPLAYAAKAPLLLTQAGSEKAADDYTDKHGIQLGYVLGGQTVITDETAIDILDIKAELLIEKKTNVTEDSIAGELGDSLGDSLGELIGGLLK